MQKRMISCKQYYTTICHNKTDENTFKCSKLVNVCSTSSRPIDPLNPFSRKTGVLNNVGYNYSAQSLVSC